MATYNIYTYLLRGNVNGKKEYFGENHEEVLGSSEEVHILCGNIEEPENVMNLKKVSRGLLVIEKMDANPLEFKKLTWGASELLEYLDLANQPYLLTATSKINYQTYPCLAAEKIVNWSQTIDDLVKVGLVHTEPTPSMMSLDPRKFNIEGDTKWLDVDCLGTAFHKDISEEIEGLWQTFYP